MVGLVARQRATHASILLTLEARCQRSERAMSEKVMQDLCHMIELASLPQTESA